MSFRKKILVGDEARQALKRGVDAVANPVKATLGPRGRLVVLDRSRYMGLGQTPLVTKDGVTVANHVDAEDPCEKLGAALCREAAQRTVDNAGDGTTTSCLLVQSMVNSGIRLLASGANSAALRRGMEKASEAVQTALEYAAKDAGKDTLRQIALVSANGDEEVASLVFDAAEAVGKDGIMLVEDSPNSQSGLTVVDGMQVLAGYDDTSPFFITDMDKAQAMFEDAYVLLYEGTIGMAKTLVPLLSEVQKAGRPLLIVAGDYSPEALSVLVLNRSKGIWAAAVRSGAFGSRRKELLKDIAVLTGGTAITDDCGRKLEGVTLADLGSAKKVIVDRKVTTISQGGGDMKVIADRVTALRRQIEESKDKAEKEACEQRLAGLAGGIAVIRVGADTDTAMKEKKDRVDDAMHAVKCAAAGGIVVGGGVALLAARVEAMKLKLAGDEQFGAQVVIRACEEPMRQIAENAGVSGDAAVEKVGPACRFGMGFNARTGVYENLDEAGVWDPANVVIEALKNAASQASMILGTEALSAEIPMEDKQ